MGHPQVEVFEILDIHTGLLVARDTTGNDSQSATVVKKREELRDSVVEAHPAETAKAEVVRHLNEEFEILDL